MVNEETISEIYSDAESREPRISKLAVTSMVFGILGPFSSGAMWMLLIFVSLLLPALYSVNS